MELSRWFADYDVPTTWVSDQGLRFKNEVLSTLRKHHHNHHHFTHPYTPRAKGAVEVLNCEAMRVIRSLLSEYMEALSAWPD